MVLKHTHTIFFIKTTSSLSSREILPGSRNKGGTEELSRSENGERGVQKLAHRGRALRSGADTSVLSSANLPPASGLGCDSEAAVLPHATVEPGADHWN